MNKNWLEPFPEGGDLLVGAFSRRRWLEPFPEGGDLFPRICVCPSVRPSVRDDVKNLCFSTCGAALIGSPESSDETRSGEVERDGELINDKPLVEKIGSMRVERFLSC